MAGQPQETLLKDWAADVFTAREADGQAEGRPLPDLRPWVSGSWAPYVSLAGSETSASFQVTSRALWMLPSAP